MKCPKCRQPIPDNYRYCDDCLKSRAFQIHQRYPGFDEKDVWQMAINELEFEQLGNDEYLD